MSRGRFGNLFSRFFRRRAADDDARHLHSEFAKRFGIAFSDSWLLRIALTHRSHQDDQTGTVSNERLEFLGDSVLGLVASDYLFRTMNEANEGDLTKARSRIVNKNTLGRLGIKLGVLDLLLYAREEIRDDERALVTLSADALEAIVGAVYLDGGFRTACEFVIDHIVEPGIDASPEHVTIDHKSKLQEICQARFRVHPEYRIIKRVGPEHRKVFHVEVRIKSETYGFGSGRSRKEAEQAAASQAILSLSTEEE